MNAGNSQWSGCADDPYFYLAGDIEKSSEKLFPKILAANVPVLLYNGKLTFILSKLFVRRSRMYWTKLTNMLLI